MKFKKENITIVEQSDIVEGIAADTQLSERVVETVLDSLRNSMVYYCQFVTDGEDLSEKFIVKLFPSFYIFISRTKPYERKLKGKTIKVPSRIRAVPKFTRYFNRRIINGLKDG